MRNLLYDCICVFLLILLLETLLPPISCAKIVNNHRTKPDVSIRAKSQTKENANHVEEIQKTNLEHERGNSNLEKDNTYVRLDKILKRSANVASSDFQQADIEKPLDYDSIVNLSSQHPIEEPVDYGQEMNEKIIRRGSNEKTSELVRVARDVNSDLDRYTDQDERSNLYDDYEAKDIAKRGILGSPGDYEEMEEEEMEENSPVLSEDAAMVQGSMLDKVKKRETQSDARVERDREKPIDRAESSPNGEIYENDELRIIDVPSQRIDLTKLEESKISADDPYYRVESSKGNGQISMPNDVSKIEGSQMNVPKSSDASKIQEPTSREHDANAEYERRAEEEIQRKIDSIKEEIQRDIEAQRQIRDIRENNARFDELQDEGHENDETQSFMNEPIEKRQTVAKRSIREASNDAAASSTSRDKKRSPKREEREKQRRSIKARELDSAKERLSRKTTNNENIKRRSANRESLGQSPSKAFLKKKRERVRQTILMNNDRGIGRRRSRAASERRDVGRKDELSVNRDLNSYHAGDNMAPSSLAGEDEEEQSRAAAERPNSMVSLTGSSQELSPRLALEYKEAFGGLQSEPGSALARFKRIKRALDNPDGKISSLR